MPDIQAWDKDGNLSVTYKWIFHYQDHFYKISVVSPLQSKNAGEVAMVLVRDVIAHYGPPVILHTDNGKEFHNELMGLVCQVTGMKSIRGRPRHPQSQGSVERANKEVKQLLRSVCQCAKPLHRMVAHFIALTGCCFVWQHVV